MAAKTFRELTPNATPAATRIVPTQDPATGEPTKSTIAEFVSQAGAAIKTAYEANADTNAFLDAEKTKLTGIAESANNYTHPNHTGDVTSTGDGTTAIAAGVIVNADVNASAAIAFSKLSGVAPATAGLNAQTGTTYTLVLADAEDVVTMSNAASNLLTIPPDSSVAFPVQTSIAVIQLGAGATSVKGGTGVTINGVLTGQGAMTARYGAVTLIKLATDTWVASGAIGTVA